MRATALLQHAPLAGVLLLALLIRIWQIDSIPPGLWFDEAVDAQDALLVWRGDQHIFFEANLGREPLYIYTLAPAVGLLGPGVLPIRLVSVAFGLLTVLGTFLLGRELFGRRIALYGAAFAAVSYWHVHLSRTGFRAISLPAVQTLGLYFAWRGLSSGSRRAILAGGGLLGLTFYTYSSSRFVTPALLGLLVLVALARPTGKEERRAALLAAAQVLLVAIVVAAPLAAYFALHPGAFVDRALRISYVSPLAGQESLTRWWESIRSTVGSLLIAGDENARHNLPGRPVLDAIAGALFLLGMPLLLRRERRIAGPFVLGWIGGALLPLTFTLETPHFLRAVGALPAIFFVPAVGLAAIHAWLGERRALGVRRLAGPLTAAALAASGALALRDYFLVWPTLPDTYYATQADVRALSGIMPDLPVAARIYVASAMYPDDLPQPLTALIGERPAVHGFGGKAGLVYPPAGFGPVLYLLPRSEMLTWANVEPLVPASSLVKRLPGPDGEDAARVYLVPAGALAPAPSRQLVARFSGAVEILGYDLPRTLTPGRDLRLLLYWRVVQPGWHPWEWGITLVDGYYRPLSRTILGNTLSLDAWRPGDVVASWTDVPVAASIEPGLYYLSLEMVERSAYGRVRVFDGTGRDVGTKLRLGPARVAGPLPPPPPDLVSSPVGFGDAIELAGYRLSAETTRPGQQLEIVLAWRALAPVAAGYHFFVHLLDGDGRLQAQKDGEPLEGAMPTSVWEPATGLVVDTLRLDVPATMPPGQATVIVGLYDLPSGRRLELFRDGRPTEADHETIGVLQVMR